MKKDLIIVLLLIAVVTVLNVLNSEILAMILAIFLLTALIAAVVIIYFLPTIIVYKKYGSRAVLPIMAPMNLLMGWMPAVWLAMLFYAVCFYILDRD